jgi:hypothetical protein
LDDTFNRSQTLNLNNTADYDSQDEGGHTEGRERDSHRNREVERNNNEQVEEARGINFDKELPDEVKLSF